MLNAPAMECDRVNFRWSVPVQKRQQIFETVPVSHRGTSFGSAKLFKCSCIAADLSPDFQHLSAVGSVVQRGGCGAPGAAARRHARLIRAPLPQISQPALPNLRAR